MQGGIGGHAGLFGTAEDVSKVMQLFLNKGTYANNKIFSLLTLIYLIKDILIRTDVV